MSRTVVVTGASSGFGRGISERLARRGDRVYASMRGTEGKNAPAAAELRGLAAAEGLDLRVLEMDVTSGASVDAAVATVLAESGAPDVVVNNAGQMPIGLTEAFSDAELSALLEVNVVGVHRVSRGFLPSMRERGRGLFLNVSSGAGRVTLPLFGIYHASKWALEGYSAALRSEVASQGVDVVIVEPGPFRTTLLQNAPRPADAARAGSYPADAHRVLDGFMTAFGGMFDDPALPTDPALLVERLVELIDMAPGTRPLRTLVGLDFGLESLNQAADAHHQGLLEGLGLREFATLPTAAPV